MKLTRKEVSDCIPRLAFGLILAAMRSPLTLRYISLYSKHCVCDIHMPSGQRAACRNQCTATTNTGAPSNVESARLRRAGPEGNAARAIAAIESTLKTVHGRLQSHSNQVSRGCNKLATSLQNAAAGLQQCLQQACNRLATSCNELQQACDKLQ